MMSPTPRKNRYTPAPMQSGTSQRATPRTGTLLVTETDIGLSGLNDHAQQQIRT
ncbi:hypothetical protein ACVIHC_003884 [Bradyrhizobium diazoefficiens]